MHRWWRHEKKEISGLLALFVFCKFSFEFIFGIKFSSFICSGGRKLSSIILCVVSADLSSVWFFRFSCILVCKNCVVYVTLIFSRYIVFWFICAKFYNIHSHEMRRTFFFISHILYFNFEKYFQIQNDDVMDTYSKRGAWFNLFSFIFKMFVQ